MSEEANVAKKTPSLFNNYISLIGAAVVIACLASILLLFLIEVTGSRKSPYVGIFAWVILPSIMIFGLFVIAVGMFRERRRRRKFSVEESESYPSFDLNDPRRRQNSASLYEPVDPSLTDDLAGVLDILAHPRPLGFDGQRDPISFARDRGADRERDPTGTARKIERAAVGIDIHALDEEPVEFSAHAGRE